MRECPGRLRWQAHHRAGEHVCQHAVDLSSLPTELIGPSVRIRPGPELHWGECAPRLKSAHGDADKTSCALSPAMLRALLVALVVPVAVHRWAGGAGRRPGPALHRASAT